MIIPLERQLPGIDPAGQEKGKADTAGCFAGALRSHGG